MITSLDIAEQAVKMWGTKTLSEFLVEAEREDSGIRFESIRSDIGERFILVMCLTDVDHIARIEEALHFVDDDIAEDWNTLTVANLVVRTVCGSGFCFESRRDEYGRRSVLFLISAEPHSIHIIEALFKLPK